MDIIKDISRYTYHKNRYDEITEQLAALTYKTTATYGNLAPAMSNTFNSKVETMALRQAELKSEQAKYKRIIDHITNMIEHSGLNEHEKGVLWCIANCERLQGYARYHRIQQSNVYKIRDRAIRKIEKRLKTQNGAQKGKMLTKNTL